MHFLPFHHLPGLNWGYLSPYPHPMDLFDRTEQTGTEAGERAIWVHLELPDAMGREDLDEFHHLVTSSGVLAVIQLTGKRDRADPALFIGIGKPMNWRHGK